MEKNLSIMKPCYFEQILLVPWPFAISKFHWNGFIFQNNIQLINRINGGILDLAKTWERISSVTLIHINRHPRELGLLPGPTVHIFIVHGIFILNTSCSNLVNESKQSKSLCLITSKSAVTVGSDDVAFLDGLFSKNSCITWWTCQKDEVMSIN